MTRSIRGGFLLAAALAATLAASAQAGPVGVTGNPVADGWKHDGNSLTNGVFVYANTNDDNKLFDFDLYSTSFQLDSVSAALLGNGWNAGDVIIGIGAVVATKTSTTNQVLNNQVRVLTKYGVSDNGFVASSAAPNDGNGVWKTLHPITMPGDPTVNPGLYGDGHGSTNFSGTGGIIMDTPQIWGGDTPWFNPTGEGDVLLIDGSVHPADGKKADATRANDPSPPDRQNINSLGALKVIYNLDNGTANDPLLSSFESYLNVSLLERAGYDAPQPGENYVIAMQQVAGPYTKATGTSPDLEVIPEPSSLVLASLGLGGLAFAVRRRARASA